MQDQSFYEGYSKIVAQSWASPEFFDALKSDPAKVLAENGIETKPSSKIYVVKVEPTGEGDVEKQVADWSKGDEDGTYYLWIPDKPQSLGENKLEDTSTTCTPCSTCT
jgi:hypothetical protein